MRDYNTKQKQLVIGFFEENRDRDFTVAEAAECLSGKVGFSSVYRITASLSAQGRLKKSFREEGDKAAVYRYFDPDACSGHLHLKCEECGALTHLSEKDTMEIEKIIGSGFTLKSDKTTLYGVCQNCVKRND
ncbi:MAG TPA: transcriptional repressor [Clostridia bacterium]|jgi:Fur family ferric uptake transcriptional regulator|nr:transcriptional repressor [Clostridia bacterium]HOL61320.1 transcriptional repressor [Clostridia bacterium]HPO54031.1 transcriptional repressor [Clostridia bacterium]